MNFSSDVPGGARATHQNERFKPQRPSPQDLSYVEGRESRLSSSWSSAPDPTSAFCVAHPYDIIGESPRVEAIGVRAPLSKGDALSPFPHCDVPRFETEQSPSEKPPTLMHWSVHHCPPRKRAPHLPSMRPLSCLQRGTALHVVGPSSCETLPGCMLSCQAPTQQYKADPSNAVRALRGVALAIYARVAATRPSVGGSVIAPAFKHGLAGILQHSLDGRGRGLNLDKKTYSQTNTRQKI